MTIGESALIRIDLPVSNGSGESIISGAIVLNPDFREFIESLNANGVRYLVGGYAVALHGHPRYTQDMDVWIQRDEENAARMIRALADFGVGSLELGVEDFLVPDQIVQLGYAPNRIDILSTLPGVEFDPCYASRVEVQLAELPVNFIDLENLKQNKRASDRHQDLADLEKLP